MIKLRLLCLLSFYSFVSIEANAAGCDSCAKAALDKTKQAVSSAVKATTNVVKANGASIDALKATVETGTATLSAHMQMISQQELTALSGVSAKITLTLDRYAEESIRATDTLVNNFKDIEDGLRKADLAIDNARSIGPQSQTMSGEINTARAQNLREGLAAKNELTKLHLANMEKWLNNTGYRHSANREKLLLLSKAEFWDVMPLLQKDRLSNEEVNNIQVLLQLLVEPEPKSRISKTELIINPNKAVEEISRRRDNVISQVSHSVLIDYLANKAPIIPTSSSWLKHYFNIEVDGDQKISFEQFYEAETIGKLTNADWFMDIKSRTLAGLQREQIYQLNTTNMLLADILKLERQETKLLAVTVLRDNL